MTPEHAPTAEPAPPSPSDGSAIPHDEPTQAGGGGVLSHTDEHQLYRSDQEAWSKYVAPGWVEMLKQADDTQAVNLWRYAQKPLKRAVWALADDSLKARIRQLTEENPR